jgi:hypothetical protein
VSEALKRNNYLRTISLMYSCVSHRRATRGFSGVAPGYAVATGERRSDGVARPRRVVALRDPDADGPLERRFAVPWRSGCAGTRAAVRTRFRAGARIDADRSVPVSHLRLCRLRLREHMFHCTVAHPPVKPGGTRADYVSRVPVEESRPRR